VPDTKSSKRTISLDFGYLCAQNSNRAIAGFNTEVLTGLGALYDTGYRYFQPETPLAQGLYYGGFWLATLPITLATHVSFENFGHTRLAYGLGAFPQYETMTWDCNHYFSQWATLVFNGYCIAPGLGAWESHMLPLPHLNTMDQHYDHLTPYVDINQLKQYDSILQSFKERLPKDPELQKLIDEEAAFEVIRSKVSEDEYNALLFANSSEPFYMVLRPKAHISALGGGLNNTVYMAQCIEDVIWFQKSQHMQVTTNYFIDKTSTFLQPVLKKVLNDTSSNIKKFSRTAEYIDRIVKVWDEDLGVHVSRMELQLYSLLSYLLSTQSYMNLYQIYQTWIKGETRVYSSEYKGFRLPNVGMYLTANGPTYNIRTGYRWGDDLFLIGGVEFVLSGKQLVEVTLGVRKTFSENTYIHGEIVANPNAVGGMVYAGTIVHDAVHIEAGMTYHNVNTLLGERHIPSLLKGPTDIEGWVKVGIQY